MELIYEQHLWATVKVFHSTPSKNLLMIPATENTIDIDENIQG